VKKLLRGMIVVVFISSVVPAHAFVPFIFDLIRSPAFRKTVENIMSKVITTVRTVGNAAASGAQTVANGAATGVKAATQAAQSGVQACTPVVTRVAQGAGQVVQTAVQGTVQVAKVAANTAGQVAQGTANATVGAIKGVVSGGADMLGVLYNPSTDYLKATGSTLIKVMKEISNKDGRSLIDLLNRFAKMPASDLAEITTNAAFKTAACAYVAKDTVNKLEKMPENLAVLKALVEHKLGLVGNQPVAAQPAALAAPALKVPAPALAPSKAPVLAVPANKEQPESKPESKQDKLLQLAVFKSLIIKSVDDEMKALQADIDADKASQEKVAPLSANAKKSS
jgi:hypothetical protein